MNFVHTQKQKKFKCQTKSKLCEYMNNVLCKINYIKTCVKTHLPYSVFAERLATRKKSQSDCGTLAHTKTECSLQWGYGTHKYYDAITAVAAFCYLI